MSSKPEIIFDVNDVNISAILEQIHDNMKTRGYDIEEMKKLSKGIEIKAPSASVCGCDYLNASTAAVNACYNVQYWWVIPNQGGLKGKLRVLTNKIMRKLTFFYMKHVFDQQNVFNANVTNAINQLTSTCNNLTVENNDLLMRLTAMNNQNASLIASLQKQTAIVDNTMSRYVSQISEIENMYAQRQSTLESINISIAARLHRIENKLTNPSADTSMEASSELTIPVTLAEFDDNTDIKHEFDYFLFESKHRGSSEEIKKRQECYLQYFEGQENVLDLGCGRGEFLEILSENNISAKGVDILAENVRCCQEKGMAAAFGDGIEFLHNCEDNSLGGIFSAQVIEHISTEKLVELIHLAHKKLKPGANLILETLNPQCLMIYAQCFYLDPSHTKPVHPESVKFIAECEGFVDNQLIYMSPSPDIDLPIPEEHPESANSIKTINYLLFGNREYALVAKK